MKHFKMACTALLAGTLLLGSCKNNDDRDDAEDSVVNSMEPNSSMPNTNPTMDSSYADSASRNMSDTSTGMNSGNMGSGSSNMGGTTGANANNRASRSTAANTRKSKKGRSTRYIVRIPTVRRSGTMTADRGGVYNFAEVMPSYRGGDRALEQFITDNLEYPQEALDNDIEGQVMVTFAVDENGRVYEPSVTSPRIGYGLEEAALDVVRRMPMWTPGSIKGRNVKTRFNLPITYQLY